MGKLFKKAYWIEPEDSWTWPDTATVHSEIAKYCEKNGYSYTFTAEDEVLIQGIPHRIRCARSILSRGHCVIKCTEK